MNCLPKSVCVVFVIPVLVNCLLNAFAICVGEVTDCLLFESDWVVLGCVRVLLANPCIVFQRVCVLCL